MNYPPGWPRCDCGKPVLDGHLTCGEVTCSETDARATRDARWHQHLAEVKEREQAKRAKAIEQECAPESIGGRTGRGGILGKRW